MPHAFRGVYLMIMLKGIFPVRPGRWKSALALIETLAKNSRLNPDCLSFDIYSRVDSPATLVIWQHWASNQALQKHLSSLTMGAFLDQLAPLLDGAVESQLFEVDTDTADCATKSVVAREAEFTIAPDVIIH